mmetsp:Transcript_17727/g.27729  ORF Transcript_17727/g.27729 Transcript_17727/m.27729 type:complete len:357 (+) Transcript_17727:3-1073(+)|eukprot:CAMPEP_0201626676 /NCGR_PEP_ID=MMETSP0493-20130528/1953_1 /ASSEMBLY_ACC=CAM_ASM_000838 /TAXON_ID=420259 /ORGANISM="Thalassiosira gravida, Strain GMp14c1" /LENGTH=356 /DNA_ID=CAMNT_0048096785 /DNA_START=134 /DNA_END=1204 /DNA_ORIENTATION=-
MFKHHSTRNAASAKAKSGALSMTPLDQSIDIAEKTYYLFSAKLKALISTLKSYHEAILAFNRSQMQTTTAICEFLINTPLSQCVIGTSIDEKNPVVLRYKHNEHGTDINSSKETNADPSTKNGTTGSKNNNWSAGSTHSFDSAIEDGTNFDKVETSFVAVLNATNDLNLIHAKNYMNWVIGYLVELEEILSTRIEGKLFQFCQMRQVCAHYTDKVQGLSDKAGKKKKGASSSLQDKLDRNRLKLSGAEEAHNEFGTVLLAFMEEVTLRYFKDFIPLLHMIIQLSIKHSVDVASVMIKLEETDSGLQHLCAEHGISIAGRLEELRPEARKLDEEAPVEEEIISEDEKKEEGNSSVAS